MLPREELVPARRRILRWIERIHAQGIRRPGYPADRWVERFCVEQLRKLGLENPRLEPVSVWCWAPRAWSLRVRSQGSEFGVPCFPLPHSAPTPRLEGELARLDPASPTSAKGRIALHEVRLLRLPPAALAAGAPDPRDPSGSSAARVPRATWCYDPQESFQGAVQVLPFGREFQAVMEPALEAGALGFVGVLSGYPGEGFQYYVPYDGVARPIPGVWIRESDGRRLAERLETGSVRATLRVDAASGPASCHNVVAELPGADDEMVVVGSHHDGPWASAVEDASGVALVLAQAAYWARVPREERPHRLVFLLNCAHMAGAAGARAFLERRRDELERIVLEIHLEHAAREFRERNGHLVPSGLPEPRWWFTSRIPPLQAAVREAIEGEALERSLMLPPEIFGPHPTTDGGLFHLEGVPLVQYLTAPFYLFDAMDTLDKIDAESLVPVTRAAIRILQSTRGVSAAALRSERIG